MRSVLGRSLLAALTTLACWSAAASAATPVPGLVTVRVEGAVQTLLPATTVLTEAGAFHPANDPVAARTCPGTSAARALELATGSIWSGTYFTSFGDYQVDSILGEAHPTGPSDGSYWAFWVDNAPAQVGICQQQLDPGDQILFFPDCFGSCPAGFVSPDVLAVNAPAAVQSGTPFTAGVVSYPNAGGPPKTLVGAAITGGGASAVTGAGGLASVTLNTPGSYLLTASAPGAVRAETTVCVHNANDGNCGTTKGAPGAGGTPPAGGAGTPTPGAPGATTPAGCVTNGSDGRCGTLDRTAPVGRLQIPEGRHYAHGRGPRTLDGTVAADPSGLRTIRLRLTRLEHGRCQVFSPKKAALVDGTCKIDRAPWFAVGPPSPFSYLLKQRLPAGRYVLDVEATDNAGNVDRQVAGRSRIVFRVG